MPTPTLYAMRTLDDGILIKVHWKIPPYLFSPGLWVGLCHSQHIWGLCVCWT